MRQLFAHRDGRLKTGRLALIIFFIVLFGLGLIFKIRKPAEQVLVKVTHIFAAEEAEQPSLKTARAAKEGDQEKPAAEKPVAPPAALPAVAAAEKQSAAKPRFPKPEEVQPIEAIGGKPERLPEFPAALIPRDNDFRDAVRIGRQEVGRAGKTVVVEKEQYRAILTSWQESGRQGGADTKIIPLRVENLKNTFDLLQMKPVAVLGKKRFIDLSDGSRLSENSLTDYSTTVFLVDMPWRKWGRELERAGVTRSDQVVVRYYMYGFMRDAIYARVNRAVAWCRENGLLGPDIPASELDVLGRTFTISRRGGGRFGVFVPMAVQTRGGNSIKIDPACFKGQPDVEVLMDKEVLGGIRKF